jgi:lipopolysaccharide cholinephosphotransferase
MSNIQEKIEQVWNVEQEILDVIHYVCTEHGLRYSLAYGTLIGAVRHGGFIPWDDDIDLVMPREDYEKLLSIWNDAAPKGYILQNIRTNPDYTNSFTKIRKDHTTFLQNEAERSKEYHKGIFVDIFPGDRVAPGKISRMLQYIACAVNLLYTRGYSSGSKGIIGMVERILLAMPEEIRPGVRSASEKFIARWNGREELQWFFPSTIAAAGNYHAAEMFREMKQIQYCGKQYCCIADLHGFLKVEYGDYMQLPPEEERVWKHCPIIIDFERNYEELNIQK